MKKISPQTEQIIMNCLEEAVEMINEGAHPNDALVKAAADAPLKPGHIQLMVQALNTGRTNAQRKQGNDLLEKVATFPLANADVVIAALYPTKVASAQEVFDDAVVSDDYELPADAWSNWEKAAGAYNAFADVEPLPPARPTHDHQVKVAMARRDDVLKFEKEAQEKQIDYEYQIAIAQDNLVDYFRDPECIPFPEVKERSEMLFGKQAAECLDKVAKAFPMATKQASRRYQAVDLQQAPYTMIQSLCNLIQEKEAHRKHAESVLDVGSEKLMRAFGGLIPKTKPEAKPFYGSILADLEKKAAAPRAIDALKTMFTIDMSRKILNQLPGQKSDDNLDSEAFQEVTDPVHEARLTNLRNIQMLNDLMANDDVVSSYDPDEVLDVYNQLSEMAPRAAQKKILTQALLRRHLAQGQLDTHDVDQLAGIEGKLKQQADPGDLRHKPSSLSEMFTGSKPKPVAEEKVGSFLADLGN